MVEGLIMIMRFQISFRVSPTCLLRLEVGKQSKRKRTKESPGWPPCCLDEVGQFPSDLVVTLVVMGTGWCCNGGKGRQCRLTVYICLFKWGMFRKQLKYYCTADNAKVKAKMRVNNYIASKMHQRLSIETSYKIYVILRKT